MDPTAAWTKLCDELREGSFDEAADTARDLSEWLAPKRGKKGYLPKQAETFMFQEGDREARGCLVRFLDAVSRYF